MADGGLWWSKGRGNGEEGKKMNSSHTGLSTLPCFQPVLFALQRRMALCVFIRFSHARVPGLSLGVDVSSQCRTRTEDTPVSLGCVTHTATSNGHVVLHSFLPRPCPIQHAHVH
ncbi:hypothetical protein GOBAR_AA15561 [Gossypium barbadense]|uniref:Uncharacterized protein n=1 Tax=Gossypium barbadense TaxID=3634 RepID=A0A2P5XP31_GOSBA|nr:hypothetical protein GOBAR_AA15561 [Gossypium barbadense]